MDLTFIFEKSRGCYFTSLLQAINKLSERAFGGFHPGHINESANGFIPVAWRCFNEGEDLAST